MWAFFWISCVLWQTEDFQEHKVSNLFFQKNGHFYLENEIGDFASVFLTRSEQDESFWQLFVLFLRTSLSNQFMHPCWPSTTDWSLKQTALTWKNEHVWEWLLAKTLPKGILSLTLALILLFPVGATSTYNSYEEEEGKVSSCAAWKKCTKGPRSCLKPNHERPRKNH